MIEQTEMVVSEWHYHAPAAFDSSTEKIRSATSFDVMRKRALDKKGIACRFSCNFVIGNTTILKYVAEDSYVIDLADVVDKNELLRMIRNSYAKFKEKFDICKLGTILQDTTLVPLKEQDIDLDAILPLLI